MNGSKKKKPVGWLKFIVDPATFFMECYFTWKDNTHPTGKLWSRRFGYLVIVFNINIISIYYFKKTTGSFCGQQYISSFQEKIRILENFFQNHEFDSITILKVL